MSNSLIEVKDLKVYFKQKSPKLLSFKPGILKAVDQVSFSIEKGKTFGLVGESGSGKSTIGKAILRYHKPTGGEIFYGGTEIGAMGEKELLPYRKKMQSVFQDPYSSLDPSHTVQDIICEPMEIHKMYTPKERKDRAKELIRVVRSPEGEISIDFTGKKSGRGAYLCANEQCLAKARKTKQLERALETAIPDEVYEKLEHQLAQGSESV